VNKFLYFPLFTPATFARNILSSDDDSKKQKSGRKFLRHLNAGGHYFFGHLSGDCFVSVVKALTLVFCPDCKKGRSKP
jgi:hypothetical protein